MIPVNLNLITADMILCHNVGYFYHTGNSSQIETKLRDKAVGRQGPAATLRIVLK